jgi:hypothetical protein
VKLDLGGKSRVSSELDKSQSASGPSDKLANPKEEREHDSHDPIDDNLSPEKGNATSSYSESIKVKKSTRQHKKMQKLKSMKKFL